MAKEVVTTINGRFTSDENAKISVYDNSLLYAEGLFETYMAVDERIAFPNEHFKRLQKGSKFVGINIPVSKKILEQWLTKTAARHSAKIKRLRVTITSGESAVWRGKRGKPQVIISVVEHKIDRTPQRLYAPELRIDADSTFNHIKSIAYGLRAAALRRALQKGYEDALLLNNKNQVSEITSANIFWVEKNRIYTPPISAGCLEGVTRRVILEQAQKQKWQIKEKNCTLETLARADEAFTTSSVRLARPVGEIGAPGFKAKIKQGHYCQTVFDHLCRMLDIE
jgi:branched-chain amino acid aminotransferase